MVVNGKDLFNAQPLRAMRWEKLRENGVSFGLSEAGYDIRIEQNLILHPFKRFALASAIEKFQMPDNLVAIVHDKSTWARQGLSVFNTVVEPGWEGYLTLELVYHGWKPLRIKAGSGIAQVIFHEINNPVAYDGKYQNQERGPVKARFE